tara:strand:- start:659 stop:2047 length:1389 start_codon:yes stop_codon:yes gene_type:complete
MPDIEKYSGVEMANISKISGVDAPSGGAFDPIAGTGTYTETVPTTGMIHYGYNQVNGQSTDLYPSNFFGNGATNEVKTNFSSDVDGFHQVFELDNLDKNWTKIDCSRYVWIGIEGGRLWMGSWNASYVHQSNPNQKTLTQVTSLSGATDTGWTDCSAGSDFAMAINGGKLFVVGENGDGQLGLGNTTDRTTLTQVGGSGGDTDWYKVSCGDDHSAAIKGASGNRSLWTTGENREGKCGSGDTSGDDTSWIERVAADSSEDWTFVEAGESHTMAIKAGKLFVTGDGSYERFGNNSQTDITTFTQTGRTSSGGAFATDWVSGSISKLKSMIINSSGEVWWAGSATYGNGQGNSSSAQSGYHEKASGSAAEGSDGSFGGSDDFSFIACARHQSFDADKLWVGINNSKLYAFGRQGGNDTGFPIYGSTAVSQKQGLAINSSKNVQVAYPWYGATGIAGFFAYFVNP